MDTLIKINKEIIKLNPTNISILIRILSGHNTLNYHLFDMGYSYNPYCEYCTTSETQNNDTAEIETATHIICDCPAFTRIRIEVYGKHIITLEKLFHEKSIKNKFIKMIKFIKKTKCFERKPKLTKKDLSPRRAKNKRKINPENSQIKRIKLNTMGQYYNKNNLGNII